MISDLHAHFVGDGNGDGIALLLDGVEHGRHIHTVFAANHEVHDSVGRLVVKFHEFVADMDVIGFDDVAHGLDVIEDAMNLNADDFGFP